MALTQSLSTGITGLMSHQKAMDNIGNNLANVNTVGFKKGVYQFTTILEQTLRGGMPADAQAGRGSVNPISLGLGTQTGSINKVFTQGPIENTGNPYDMAIDGNGFFVLRMENSFVYTRAGSFYRGADGALMAGNGLYVQGTMAVKNSNGSVTIPQDAKLQNIIIPLGTTGGHNQTSEVSFMGNLDSRQEISTGTRLFGGSSFPTVSNLQQWMWKTEWNGGDPISSGRDVDTTWDSLESRTYSISRATLELFGAINDLANLSRSSSINIYDNSVVVSFDPSGNPIVDPRTHTLLNTANYVYAVYDVARDRVITHTDRDWPLYDAINPSLSRPIEVGGPYWNNNFVPLVEEVKAINGGNVQTSAAYSIRAPEYLQQSISGRFETYYRGDDGKLYEITNSYTYPQWFYESTGGNFSQALAMSDADFTIGANTAIRSIWSNGFNNDPIFWPTSRNLTVNDLPRANETYPASLTTPLGHLQYLKGNVWVQPFADISNGKEIEVSFKKGDSLISATFIYNRPVGPGPFNGQQSVDRELSYTLEHFLKFMAGDVNEASVTCQRITPAMFGAPVDTDYPDGNYVQTGWDRYGYELALKNVALAESEGNWDNIGGVMGLLSIPPQISNLNYGSAAYDAPLESAGAFTRTGVQTDIYYDRWDPATGQMIKVKGDSFNTSFVSNLGAQNALSDIRIVYNNVPHETMYKAETEYNAPQGGSAIVTVDFYDSLGNPKQATVRLAMVHQDTDFTTWRWYADCIDDTDFPWQADPNTGELISNLNVGTGLIRFDKDGNFVPGSDFSESGGITINQTMQGVNEPIVISIINHLSSGMKQGLDFSELTCTAIPNSFKLETQNGRPPGTLLDFTVSLDGVIQGTYSNGNVVPLARIGLALIPNENGLIAAGNNLFYVGPASGDPLYGHANLGGTGQIRHMQLESSNVDLSEEFTKLISIERGFQANSRTITTSDEMILELLNLKR
ncbi:MAG: flagellar hook-basal body complex protein [Planctomycetes bacterium]|nr:flagellar hook-basal body complex protein [Planctomycetota bacterium]